MYGNKQCDEACNNRECGYDNGRCTASQITESCLRRQDSSSVDYGFKPLISGLALQVPLAEQVNGRSFKVVSEHEADDNLQYRQVGDSKMLRHIPRPSTLGFAYCRTPVGQIPLLSLHTCLAHTSACQLTAGRVGSYRAPSRFISGACNTRARLQRERACAGAGLPHTVAGRTPRCQPLRWITEQYDLPELRRGPERHLSLRCTCYPSAILGAPTQGCRAQLPGLSCCGGGRHLCLGPSGLGVAKSHGHFMEESWLRRSLPDLCHVGGRYRAQFTPIALQVLL